MFEQIRLKSIYEQAYGKTFHKLCTSKKSREYKLKINMYKQRTPYDRAKRQKYATI